jgi:predicted GNAT family acetyltransferase
MSEVETVHNPDEQRYEARIGGELAGIAAYDLSEDAVVLTHTEVDDTFEGHGVGSALARFALDDVRRGGLGEGRRVVPQCPFIQAWIEKHPDYADLVDGS